MNFKQSPMYTPSNGTPKKGFILHGTLGNYEGAVDWLSTNRTEHPSSAHYIIGKNIGEVIQIVGNEDIAWHAGTVQNPTVDAQGKLLKDARGKYINPNQYTIGIEFVWFVGDSLTEWQYATAIEIIKSSGINSPILLDHHSICDYKLDNMLFAVNEINKRLLSAQLPSKRDQAAFALRDWQVSLGIMDFAHETDPNKIKFGPKSQALFNQ